MPAATTIYAAAAGAAGLLGGYLLLRKERQYSQEHIAIKDFGESPEKLGGERLLTDHGDVHHQVSPADDPQQMSDVSPAYIEETRRGREAMATHEPSDVYRKRWL